MKKTKNLNERSDERLSEKLKKKINGRKVWRSTREN